MIEEFKKSDTHEKQKMLPPLPDFEHIGSSSPADAVRALLHFVEAAVQSAHQHADDHGDGIIIAESALRFVAEILHSKKLGMLVETLKKENAVCDIVIIYLARSSASAS